MLPDEPRQLTYSRANAVDAKLLRRVLQRLALLGG